MPNEPDVDGTAGDEFLVGVRRAPRSPPRRHRPESLDPAGLRQWLHARHRGCDGVVVRGWGSRRELTRTTWAVSAVGRRALGIDQGDARHRVVGHFDVRRVDQYTGHADGASPLGLSLPIGREIAFSQGDLGFRR